ncbi:MAG: hypothetical protein J7J22_05480 [Candidatus Verstraetearchaeota archaeon]|nr:hypothetical protein [Candidatus Verstraetearchaeota archaeon]
MGGVLLSTVAMLLRNIFLMISLILIQQFNVNLTISILPLIFSLTIGYALSMRQTKIDIQVFLKFSALLPHFSASNSPLKFSYLSF